jgi:hypothetical protein
LLIGEVRRVIKRKLCCCCCCLRWCLPHGHRSHGLSEPKANESRGILGVPVVERGDGGYQMEKIVDKSLEHQTRSP